MLSRLWRSCILKATGLTHAPLRLVSTSGSQTPLHEIKVEHKDTINPYDLVAEDMSGFRAEIRRTFDCQASMKPVVDYYFTGEGKSIRPLLVFLIARATNAHLRIDTERLQHGILEVAMMAELIHGASLVHDDIIDRSVQRRGKPSINIRYGQRLPVFAGSYISAAVVRMMGSVGDLDAISSLAQLMNDLVKGEFIQMSVHAESGQWFPQYIEKTYKKTGSLIANSCLSAASLCGADNTLKEHVFQFGRNFGIAFQIVDDLLDFVLSAEQFGKPVAADLKLGLATAPVIYAALEYPELKTLIARKFEMPGDVEEALRLVHCSDGIEKTRKLAAHFCSQALENLSHLSESMYKTALMGFCLNMPNRKV